MKRPLHSLARVPSAGMTLIEILAVLAVVIILFSLLMGLTGSASVKGDKSLVAKDLSVLESVIEEDRVTRGRYIPSDQVSKLFTKSDARLVDPWGAEYLKHYIVATNRLSYVIGSPGPDGKVGKAFVDDDQLNGVDDIGEFGLYDDILNTARKE